MTPYYSLNDIPYDVEPFRSIAGRDDCMSSLRNYFIHDTDHTGYDHGTHASFDNSIAIKTPDITTKEYIEILYGLRRLKTDAEITFSGISGLFSFSRRDYNWTVNFSLDMLPVLSSDRSKYLAPASRCLINNRFNKRQANAYESAEIQFSSSSAVLGRPNDYDPVSYVDHLDAGSLGRVFPVLGNLWERKYSSELGINFDNYTGDDTSSYGYLGKALIFSLPEFTHYHAYQYLDNNYFKGTTIRLARPISNINRANDLKFIFKGNTYETFVSFHGVYIDPNDTSEANITIEVEEFNFLDTTS